MLKNLLGAILLCIPSILLKTGARFSVTEQEHEQNVKKAPLPLEKGPNIHLIFRKCKVEGVSGKHDHQDSHSQIQVTYPVPIHGWIS